MTLPENPREASVSAGAPAPTDPALPPRGDRAMDALELAAVAAERGVIPGNLAKLPTRDDFLAAAKLDPRAVRDRLDRVVMGNDPELGLDTLLFVGALDAIFPEVHAMVG